VAKTAGAATVTVTSTGTCPAGVTTPIGGLALLTDGIPQYCLCAIIGDVGTYHIDSLADAQALCAGAVATWLNYVLCWVTGTGAGADVLAVVAGDVIRTNPVSLTF
jgi:hypothetical protein